MFVLPLGFRVARAVIVRANSVTSRHDSGDGMGQHIFTTSIWPSNGEDFKAQNSGVGVQISRRRSV